VWFGGWHDTPVHDRPRLGPGQRLAGPLIIEEDGGTTVVPPGWSVEVLPCGTLAAW
jgi:N-methylhydantoinase A/oxoprolinase/acetone carboxylase beta subunit